MSLPITGFNQLYINARLELILDTDQYWQFLADNASDILLSLYKSLNPEFASQMELQDLLDSDGKYNPLNKWNGVLKEQNGGLTIVQPGCIVHLAQRYNTLGAEIDSKEYLNPILHKQRL